MLATYCSSENRRNSPFLEWHSWVLASQLFFSPPLLVGNGSKSPPLSSAEGCTENYVAFQSSSQFCISANISLFGKKCRQSRVKKKYPNTVSEYWGVLQNQESSHEHMLERISLSQADELIQAVTTLFPSGAGCHCFPGPPDARLLLQNLSPLAAQWKELFYALAFFRIPPVLFSVKVHHNSCLFLRL